MIGIYKIISPSNRIYIGQSIKIEDRIKSYKNLKCKEQPKLYKSLLKYGFENHKIEILIECNESKLNELERHYQEEYDSIENGLNCIYTKTNDRSGKLSEETKLKISLNNTRPFLGKKHSEESRLKMSSSLKGNQSRLGAILSEETKKKISDAHNGKTHSEQSKLNMSLVRKGVKREYSTNRERLVLDLLTGVFYNSIKEASELLGYNKVTLRNYLAGNRKNITSLTFV